MLRSYEFSTRFFHPDIVGLASVSEILAKFCYYAAAITQTGLSLVPRLSRLFMLAILRVCGWVKLSDQIPFVWSRTLIKDMQNEIRSRNHKGVKRA